jgi:hypothetical protein
MFKNNLLIMDNNVPLNSEHGRINIEPRFLFDFSSTIIDYKTDISPVLNDIRNLNKTISYKQEKLSNKKIINLKQRKSLYKLKTSINGTKNLNVESIVIENIFDNYIEISNRSSSRLLVNFNFESNGWLKINLRWLLSEADAICAAVIDACEDSAAVIMPPNGLILKIKIDIVKACLVKNKNECTFILNDGTNYDVKCILEYYSQVCYNSVPCIASFNWPVEDTSVYYYNADEVYVSGRGRHRGKIDQFCVTIKSISREVLKFEAECKNKTFKKIEGYVQPFSLKQFPLVFSNDILKTAADNYDDEITVECGSGCFKYKFILNIICLASYPEEIILENAYPNINFPTNILPLKSIIENNKFFYETGCDKETENKNQKFCYRINNTFYEKLNLIVEEIPESDFDIPEKSNSNLRSKNFYDRLGLIRILNQPEEKIELNGQFAYYIDITMSVMERELLTFIPLFDQYEKIYVYKYFRAIDKYKNNDIILKAGFSLNIPDKNSRRFLNIDVENRNLEFIKGSSVYESVIICNKSLFPVLLRKICFDDQSIKMEILNCQNLPLEIMPGEMKKIFITISADNNYNYIMLKNSVKFHSISLDFGYYNFSNISINIECVYKNNISLFVKLFTIIMTIACCIYFLK